MDEVTHIDVRIPWAPGKRLGEACNRMFQTVDDWAVILDWDVALVNLDWYDICLRTIATVGHRAGLISCMTNRIGCPLQKAPDAPASDVLDEHREYSVVHQTRYTGELLDVTESDRKLSGMFFLTHREAWDRVGGVPPDKFIGMDNWYHDRIREAGYRIYVMRDLYVYHGYRRQWKGKQ